MARRRGSSWKPTPPEDHTWYIWEGATPSWGTAGFTFVLDDGIIEMSHRLSPEQLATIKPGHTLYRSQGDTSHSATDPTFWQRR